MHQLGHDDTLHSPAYLAKVATSKYDQEIKIIQAYLGLRYC